MVILAKKLCSFCDKERGPQLKSSVGRQLLILLLLCVANQHNAQAQVLVPNRFTEALQSDAPVVGSNSIRGITLLNGIHTVAPEALTVVLPPGPAARLCVVAESQDAQYYAELEYGVDKRSSPEKVTLKFPTKYQSTIRKYKTRDFGISAILASSCYSTNGTYLPIAWGEKTSGKYIVLISAGVPNINVSVFSRSNNKYYSCKRDDKSNRLIAFDTECELELSQQSGFSELVITRKRNGEFLSDVVVKSYLPWH